MGKCLKQEILNMDVELSVRDRCVSDDLVRRNGYKIDRTKNELEQIKTIVCVCLSET